MSNLKSPSDSDSKSLDATERLAEKLTGLESQVSRLTDFLTEQAEAKQKRRRRITIRSLLAVMVVFAAGFAWLSTQYRHSLLCASAVDQLLAEGSFVMYEPREGFLLSLLPGSIEDPPGYLIDALGSDFFRSVSNVSTKTVFTGKDKKNIIPAVAKLTQLKRLRLCQLSLTTKDLFPLLNLKNLESLDLSKTRLDNGTLLWLRNTKLRWFDGSHTYLGDRVAMELAQCRDLQVLNMERTTITDAGLKHLHGKRSLSYLNIKRCPVTAQAVIKLSKTIPNCVIEYEPLKFRADGRVDVVAARRGSMRLGRGVPQDPRGVPQAPQDSLQVNLNNYYYQPTSRNRAPVPIRSGYQLTF